MGCSVTRAKRYHQLLRAECLLDTNTPKQCLGKKNTPSHSALPACPNPAAGSVHSSHCPCCGAHTCLMLWRPLAGIVGYLTMLRPTGARSPYIIMAVNCVWVAVAAFIALKAEFR